MADAVRVTVDVRGFKSDLAKLEKAMAGRALNAAAMAGGIVIEAEARQNIIRYDFIDTGATLNSVAAVEAGTGVVEVGPETEYAIFGELGIGQSEKPFMREAVEQNTAAIEAAIAAELREAIRRAL